MTPKALDVGAQLVERTLGCSIVDVHVGDRRQVDLGALELSDGGPQDLALLAYGSLRGELDDGVAHAPKLGGRV